MCDTNHYMPFGIKVVFAGTDGPRLKSTYIDALESCKSNHVLNECTSKDSSDHIASKVTMEIDRSNETMQVNRFTIVRFHVHDLDITVHIYTTDDTCFTHGELNKALRNASVVVIAFDQTDSVDEIKNWAIECGRYFDRRKPSVVAVVETGFVSALNEVDVAEIKSKLSFEHILLRPGEGIDKFFGMDYIIDQARFSAASNAPAKQSDPSHCNHDFVCTKCNCRLKKTPASRKIDCIIC